jgi:hypothetical protein
MMVYWDHILVGRGWRDFKSGLASIKKITPFNPADREHVNTAQVLKLVLENHQDNSRFVHCTGVICENCTQHCPCTTGILECLCMVGTKICDGSSRKLIFGGSLSLLQSFKGGANGFPESMMTLWDMVSPFYSKWTFMQWTHPSSLRTTKCKVCQYAVFCAARVIICDMLWWLH